MDPVAFLTGIVPPPHDVRVEADGVATAYLGPLLLAAWDGIDGSVTVAGYTVADGKCRHLWAGPCTREGAVAAATELRGEGVDLRVPPPPAPIQVRPTKPLPPPTLGLDDILDLFG